MLMYFGHGMEGGGFWVEENREERFKKREGERCKNGVGRKGTRLDLEGLTQVRATHVQSLVRRERGGCARV